MSALAIGADTNGETPLLKVKSLGSDGGAGYVPFLNTMLLALTQNSGGKRAQILFYGGAFAIAAIAV